MAKQTKDNLFGTERDTSAQGPVECLGLKFPNDEARRAHFTERLREKLKDPAFRKIEGFPIGEDEDILALSDPPYYTACPNPFLDDFVKCHGKVYIPETDQYHQEPFAADVTEGKNDPVYNAHSYHTKVPHKAIMRYILHYTKPGDIIFDGFCGTGMAGVAARLCGDRPVVESLGFKVQTDGSILDHEQHLFSAVGPRYAVLTDLSPAAAFISSNYNSPVTVSEYEQSASRILADTEAECSWMYLTLHQPKPNQLERSMAALKKGGEAIQSNAPDLPWGQINFTVWSDVFICSECTKEVVFWEAAVDKDAGEVRDEFACPKCKATLTKRSVERAWRTQFDKGINESIRQAKQVPVLINYTFGKKRFEKSPDEFDLQLIEGIANGTIPHWYPTDRMPDGEESRRNDDIGMTHVHHFYTKRNLWVLSSFAARCRRTVVPQSFLFILTGAIPDLMKSARLHITPA